MISIISCLLLVNIDGAGARELVAALRQLASSFLVSVSSQLDNN